MDFSGLILWFSFVFCLSLTVTGILLVFRVERGKRTPALQFLQYAILFFYVFGYYGPWSRLLLPLFLEQIAIESVLNLVSLLALPFYLVSQSMLVLWVNRTLTTPSPLYIALPLALSALAVFLFTVVSGVGTGESLGLIAVIGMAINISLALILTMQKNSQLNLAGQHSSVAVLVGVSILYLSSLSQLSALDYFGEIFVFLLYLLHTLLVGIYIYCVELVQHPHSFDDFNRRFGITRREADVICGIYSGKTNQEIASELFISLQTVKDHASRVYQKVGVRNRAQLTALLRSLETS